MLLDTRPQPTLPSKSGNARRGAFDVIEKIKSFFNSGGSNVPWK